MNRRHGFGHTRSVVRANARGQAGGEIIITATQDPVLAALTDAQTPADGYTAGTYASTAGTISSAVETYFVNGSPEASAFDLTAGDDVRVSVLVTDSVGNTRTFSTAIVTVTPSVALSNTAAPTVAGDPEVGVTATATPATWAGSAPRTVTGQWLRDGVAIPGETGLSYTYAATDDLTDVAYREIADDGFTQVTATSAAASITYPAPVAAGALADQSYDQDTGIQTVDASGDFTGAVGGTWSVTGTGASISQAGVVSITTDALRTGSVVTVTYTNSGGSDSSAFSVTVSDPTSAQALLLSVGGQSNARTAGNSGGTPDAKYTGSMGDTFIWSVASGDWVSYVVGTTSGHEGGLDSGVWGSEAEFVYQLRQAGDTRPVYIVKECTNGQALAAVGGGDWSPSSSGERYDGYVGQMTNARADLDGAGTTYEQVMLWCQGEADTNTVNQPADDEYLANFEDLLANLAADSAFDSDGMWIIERIRPYTDADKPLTGAFKVREAQETAAANSARVKVISLDFDPSQITSLHPVEPWTENKGLRCYAMWDGTYDATYGAVSDAAPDAFAFTDQTEATPSAVVTSNQLTLSGLGGHSDVTVTGGEYRVLNSDDTSWQDWTAAAGTIHPGQKLQLRVTASASTSTAVSATVTVGGVSDTWSVTTYASAPSYEAETSAFIAQVSTNGGGSISGADADALDAFYVSAKATTWWSKLLRMYVRLGDQVASSLDVVDQATSLSLVNPSGLPYVWSAEAGWSPQENSNTGIDLKVDPSTEMPQDDASVGVFYSAFSSDTRGELNGGASIFLRNTTGGASRYLLNSSGNTNASGLGTTAGLRAITRTGAAALNLHGIDGSIIATGTAASVAPTGTGLCLGNAAFANLSGGAHSADASMFGAFAAGSALTEAEMQSLVTICNTLQDHFDPGVSAAALVYGGETVTYGGETVTYGG